MTKPKTFYYTTTWLVSLILVSNFAGAQTAKTTSLSLWEGMFVAGYVGNGAYINCGGPAVKWSMKPFSISLGLFPAVRIKEDKVKDDAKKNSTILPSTGVGITSTYKHFVLQIPLFYDSKTASTDGKWNLGVGIGYKF